MNKRKICIFTGNRSDYDLLRPILLKIKNDKSFNLQLVISGSHFSKQHGFTYKLIFPASSKQPTGAV